MQSPDRVDRLLTLALGCFILSLLVLGFCPRVEPGELQASADRITAETEIPGGFAGVKPHPGVSLPWVLSPVGCEALDATTALWAKAHRPEFYELNMTNSINHPARLIAIKAGIAAVRVLGVWAVGKAHKPSAKILATATCGWNVYASGSNLGLWAYKGPRTGL